MIGKKLIELRTKMRMTQKEVAAKLKISRSTYSNYESNFREPDFKNVEILADLFGVSVDHLLGRDEKEGVESEDEREDRIILETIKNIKDPETKKAAIEVLKGLARKN